MFQCKQINNSNIPTYTNEQNRTYLFRRIRMKKGSIVVPYSHMPIYLSSSVR